MMVCCTNFRIITIILLIISGCRSVDNFQTKALVSVSTPSPDEEEIIINEQAVDNNSAPFVISTCSTLSSPGCSSSAANMPYLGPTSRKRSKVDETDELFRETLTNLNKSMAAASAPAPPLSSPPSIDSDVLISKNVESCLKSLTNMTLKLKYRRKFRSIIQDCEEEAEDLKLSDFLDL